MRKREETDARKRRDEEFGCGSAVCSWASETVRMWGECQGGCVELERERGGDLTAAGHGPEGGKATD